MRVVGNSSTVSKVVHSKVVGLNPGWFKDIHCFTHGSLFAFTISLGDMWVFDDHYQFLITIQATTPCRSDENVRVIRIIFFLRKLKFAN